MTGLVKYEAACRAVAEAVSIDEAKDLRDKGEAMRAYARQAKNKDLEVQAAEIRIRAERRIGELMAAQRQTEGLNKGGRPTEKTGLPENPVSPPTLAEAGIDKNLADRARKLAAIPEEEFNGIVGEWKERVEAENARVTVNLLAAGQKATEAQAQTPKETEDRITAKIRREFRKLTKQAQEDEFVGIRRAFHEERVLRRKAQAEIRALKAKVKDLEDDDKNAVTARLSKQIEHMRSEMFRANDAAAAKAVAARKAKDEAKSLRKQLEAQEIPLS